MKITSLLPGLKSYRGRYLYFMAVLLLTLSLFTFNNWKNITQASELSQQNITQRNKNANTLNKVLHQIPTIKAKIYQYSLDPDTNNKIEINRSITHLLELTSKVDISIFDNIDPIQLNNLIVQIPIQLHSLVLDLIAIRSNTDLWIPATTIMSEQLLPTNENIVSTLNDMIQSIDQSQNVESILINQKLLAIKTLWIKIISEFRLIITNKFGLFEQPSKSQPNRLNNLQEMLVLLEKYLDDLELHLTNDEFEFNREIFYPQLKTHIAYWNKLHIKTIQLIQSKNWRKDIAILKKIEQLLESFNNTFISLRTELNNQSIQDIQNLNKINHSLSMFIIVLSVLGLIIAIIGYLFIDRNILRPIGKTTRALLLQSKGLSQELNINSSASETRNLIDAFNQMSEQIKLRESRLDFMAHHDALTQLPNRLLFKERLDHAIKLIERTDNHLSLMLLDLDRFKIINDTLGHLFGDKLLQEIATRLKKHLRAEDTIARLGGDEFAIIIENIHNPDEITKYARKIVKVFSKPFHIESQNIHITTSIGIAMAPLNSTDPTTLIRYADIAMYQSKEIGRNQFTLFSKELEIAEESIINFENKLREAIANNQFEIHYQPLVDTDDSNFISCEALLRWNHPEKGFLHPDQFISMLDNSALLFDLTCWVMRNSQQFQAKIKETYNILPTISVNFPPAVFQQKMFRDKIINILMEETTSPENLIIEVTEDTLITDMESTSICLNKLHDYGFKIALDDFGSGQSSLSHLRVFPIDIIKIDKEFIRNVHKKQSDANLVSAIISMGHDLGMRVIAEGVEKKQQLDFLNNKGCHYIQGFYFSQPLPEAKFLEYLNKKNQDNK